MLRKLAKHRSLGVLLLLIVCLLSLFNYTGKHQAQDKSQSNYKDVIRNIKEDVIEVDQENPDKDVHRRPTVTLLPPADIEQAVGDEEWISRTIQDKNVKCAQILRNYQEDHFVRNNMSCQLPSLDPFNPSIMKYIKELPRTDCRRYKSCGKLVDGILHFTDSNIVSATYQPILRKDDFNYIMGTSKLVSPGEKIANEFIEVEYKLRNGKHRHEYFLQPVTHEHLLNQSSKKRPGIPLNILIVGIHALSHANAIRKLPKFYEYLKYDLGAFIFNGHSTVGNDATEQLTTMLTGQGQREQYESRRNHENAQPLDAWPWIYKQLKEHGYLTGYSEDAPHIGPFQHRLLGFKEPPTDLYTRAFYMRVHEKLEGKDHCLGSRNIVQHQFDYIGDVFTTYSGKLKFLFSYNVLYSQDDLNNVQRTERHLLSLVQDLKTHGHLNNTLLIVMGDHGFRFRKTRTEIHGQLEERLPLFSMAFPPWFATRYPKLSQNLRTNTNRLTSWYDVYATLRHMLSCPDLPSALKHGQSLFQEVLVSRNCEQANIDLQWCPCQEWPAVDTTVSHVQNAALAAVEYINSLNKRNALSAKYCKILSLKTVNYAYLERPNEKVLSLKGADADRARPARNFCRYELEFETTPNNGVYRVTARYHHGWFIISKSIRRLNRYGHQADCIAKSLPHRKQFCSCTSV